MSLKSDIDELREGWSKFPWWGRLILVLYFFSNTSAIASLSDTIVKWKGFFRDTIDFYHQWIGNPLRKLFLAFDLHLDPLMIDGVILYCLIFGSLARLFVIHTNWHDRMQRVGTPLLIFVIVSLAIKIIYEKNDIVFGRLSSENWRQWVPEAGLLLGVMLSPIMARLDKLDLMLYYLPILASVLIVGIFAAINAGLTA